MQLVEGASKQRGLVHVALARWNALASAPERSSDAREANQIVVCTAVTAPKVKALSSRPNVAMTIDAGDTPTEAKAELVRGLASVDIGDGVPREYVAASTKALGADQVTEFERQVRSMYDQMARISVEPAWARFFDFGAGRMPSFLTKLAGDA